MLLNLSLKFVAPVIDAVHEIIALPSVERHSFRNVVGELEDGVEAAFGHVVMIPVATEGWSSICSSCGMVAPSAYDVAQKEWLNGKLLAEIGWFFALPGFRKRAQEMFHRQCAEM